LIRSFRDALIITILLTTGISVSAVKAQTVLVEMSVANLPIKLTYDPALVRPHAITPNEKKEVDEADADGVTITYVLETKFRVRSQKYYVIVCSSGGSADFNCMFRPVGKSGDPFRSQIEGVRFEISGDDCVYASGHVNTMFDHRRKYCLVEDDLKEIRQPFHFVGLKSTTLRDLTFYSDKAGTSAVGTIPKGDFVEVLVASTGREKDDAEHIHFLIRDRNGLTGWVDLAFGQEAKDIAGIFFAGD
jgi:hypothetical protein